MPKPMLVVLILSSLAFAILASISTAHDPSEAGSIAHPHQLAPPWPYHMATVLAGFMSLAGAALTARFLKRRKGWIDLHKKLALISVVFVLSGLSIAAYMVSVYMETYFVREVHAYLGASSFVFIMITPILGILQFRSKHKRLRTIHRWSGRITLMLMMLTIFVGVQMVLTVISKP